MTKILVLGAHPDDAEFFAGGFLARHAKAGSEIRILSVTNGQSGHQSIPSSELIAIRRQEAANSGAVIGATYLTGEFPDGSLQATLELREFIIREIRSFAPDLVLTHRPFDYHPDHRAVGQAVQDASYMVLVPKVVPDVPTPEREPIVAYMNDLFTTPCPFRADVVLDVSQELDTIIEMMASHRSQFFDWMLWIDRSKEVVPTDPKEQLGWLRQWFLDRMSSRVDRFWNGQGERPEMVEAFEVSEYAGQPTAEKRKQLFFQ